jgi:hypothetical protein
MLKRTLVLVFLVMTVAGFAWSEEDIFPMPADMEYLLPADPAFIAVISSVNELDRHWQAIEEMVDEEDGEPMDIVDYFSQQLPNAEVYLDFDRPLGFAMGLPDLMGGEEPAFTFILPVTGAFDEQAQQELEMEDATLFRRGDYLALSMDPFYSPGESQPYLAQGLNPGFFSSSIDLEMVIEAYRPLAEMGLGAMANAPAPPDTSLADPGSPAPVMSPEETEAMMDMAQILMDSARRFDLAVSVAGEDLTLHTGFAVQPGCPLDAGPQPSFEAALQLTRLLPKGGNFIQAMALDQTRQFEVIKPMYLMSMEDGLEDMHPEQAEAYRTWIASYMDSLDLFANPLAASMSMTEEGVTANMVMESADAETDLGRFADLFAGLSAADIGIQVKKMPTGKVSGVEVHSWTVDYDAEKLATFSSDPMNPQMGGTGRMQAEQMISFLRKVTPNVNMAVRGDNIILSADPDPSRLAHMIQASSQKRGAAIPEVAAVAAQAGDACQQVITGDMMSIISWVTEWMEEIEDEEYAAIQGNPIPFTSAFTIENGEYGLDWTMDMPSVQRFVQAMEQLEDMTDDDSDEDDEDDEAPVDSEDEDDE